MTLSVLILIIIHELCSTGEQIFFKKGADRFGDHRLKNIRDILSFIKNILRTKEIWLGFVMIAGAWTFWFLVLSRLELSVAVPMDSLQYVMVLFASYFLLRERMHWTRLLGTLLILTGVAFVAVS